MAITVTTLAPYPYGFANNGVSADASGCEELVAAVAGKSHYIEGIIISTGAAISVTIGAGETGGAVTASILGPIAFSADSTLYWKFARPIKVAAATAIVVDTSGAGAVTVFVEGYTE